MQSRTQGSRPRTQKNPRQDQGQGQPFRGQTLSRPRTGMLKTKDTAASALPKKKQIFKKVFQAISNSYANPELMIGGGLSHKSHAMTSSKIFPKKKFLWGKHIVGWKILNRCLLALNPDFTKREGLN